MGGFGWLAANVGLAVLSLLAVGLVAYLAWVIVHPERF